MKQVDAASELATSVLMVNLDSAKDLPVSTIIVNFNLNILVQCI